ncbi:SDR family oxidoreductase [Spongiibacter sp. KMU-166]|uniref:SDR family oxidoreductase n=1 Tax=Spongiibacter thalassae TaxID=2721624 RepID=A0ABX1GB52_9GAMM|nr:SDR family oxidoreductase [Spongiibacter thalassae]NKI16375.1 SDR family oxidoreductase [Spongiibacter thalassae]
MNRAASGESDFPQVGGALVVGGTGGLGREIVRRLAHNGVHVAFTYNSNRDAAVVLQAELVEQGAKVSAYQLDLMDQGSIKTAVESVAEAFGGLHTVVYAAGVPLYLSYISKIAAEDMLFHMQSDVMGFFHILQTSLPHVRAARGSYIACCSCGLDKWPIKDALSVVPKSGIAALVKGVAREEGHLGVRANVVGTGVMDAGITRSGRESGDIPESFITGAIKTTPLGRLGEAGDVAEAVLFLASQRARFITGQTLNVDGGWTA